MKIQFSLFKVFLLLTACAVCLSRVAEFGPRSLIAIPVFAVVGIGTFAAVVISIRLLLLLFTCLQRCGSSETDTACQGNDISEARSISRRVDTVVATADSILF